MRPSASSNAPRSLVRPGAHTTCTVSAPRDMTSTPRQSTTGTNRHQVGTPGVTPTRELAAHQVTHKSEIQR